MHYCLLLNADLLSQECVLLNNKIISTTNNNNLVQLIETWAECLLNVQALPEALHILNAAINKTSTLVATRLKASNNLLTNTHPNNLVNSPTNPPAQSTIPKLLKVLMAPHNLLPPPPVLIITKVTTEHPLLDLRAFLLANLLTPLQTTAQVIHLISRRTMAPPLVGVTARPLHKIAIPLPVNNHIPNHNTPHQLLSTNHSPIRIQDNPVLILITPRVRPALL